MPRGTLTLQGDPIPVSAPPYPTSTNQFSGITVVTIAYRVTLASIQHLIPDMLEVEDEPLVQSMFLEYGMSTVGAYNEFVHLVEVTYQGRKYDFPIVLILDNESAIFAGREVFGYPKVFGRVDIKRSTGNAVLLGSVQRPIGEEAVSFEFLPERRADAPPPSPSTAAKLVLNLRVIPSAVPGQPPAVRELVPVQMDMELKDIWYGKGRVSFPKKSLINPWADADIIKYEAAWFAEGVSAVLQDPVQTFVI
ncbi:acetoacetate decarboxylase [Diplodia corticola]|uniref:Acetoacetate decarboxylase n=1 Tax=Diplodia corticola TaxID=236234 RepID=A0A1J9QMI0_9PEZI|nr:acetoacetate decarboxylase [Diplodia corticola]OJD29681.1 acetoacetate decarboxylase [Diplodia corticola]